jgi:hypothetical protein
VIQTRERQAAHELLTGATVALVDSADLAAADAAIAAALKDRGQLAVPRLRSASTSAAPTTRDSG